MLGGRWGRFTLGLVVSVLAAGAAVALLKGDGSELCGDLPAAQTAIDYADAPGGPPTLDEAFALQVEDPAERRAYERDVSEFGATYWNPVTRKGYKFGHGPLGWFPTGDLRCINDPEG